MARRYLLAIVGVAVVAVGVYVMVDVRAAPAVPPIVAIAPADLPRFAVAPPPPPPRAFEPAATDREAEVPPRLPPPVNDVAAAVTTRGVATPVLPTRSHLGLKGRINPALDPAMKQALGALEQGDYTKAKLVAAKVLSRFPNNSAMLHVMGAASCAQGDAASAQRVYTQLSPADRAALKKQCTGVALTDPTP